MKIRIITLALCFMIPFAVCGAERSGSARVGMTRGGGAAATRMPSLAPVSTKKTPTSKPVIEQRASVSVAEPDVNDEDEEVVTVTEKKKEQTGDCREVYRACMDDFCLLDETEGSRCVCSDNIEKSKKLIREIQQIQSEADDLFTTGVEREKLGAKAKLVFGESEAAKNSGSGIDFASWLGSDDVDDGDLAEDVDVGQSLYNMASSACTEELKRCGSKASMEEKLYSRQIVADCKAFSAYLSDQKRDAEANKKTGEAAVRKARLEMVDTTNKYNRGECLLVFRSCVADKGGCGVNFENCLDSGLLTRRSHACEDVLDQCMAVRTDVLADWEEESELILKDAAKYADKNSRKTCLAQIQNCLEEGCSTSTETACLTDVKVAAGICPIITECNSKVPGLQDAIADKLDYLRLKFCENDVDACLKDKCGNDFTKPECVGKEARQIASDMCPQRIFPSCKHMIEDDFEVIISSAMLHMDYQLLTGCVNQFSEKLTAVCGTDMSCIPVSELVNPKTENGKSVDMSKWVDLKSADGVALKEAVWKSAEEAVDKFFEEFSQDKTLSDCRDVISGGQSTGKVSLKSLGNRRGVLDSVNVTAKMIAKISAKNRADRELASMMDQLKIKEETNASRKYCLEKYKEEQKPSTDSDEENKNYSYIRSVTYEADLHNCHVCRVQQVCERGGQNKWSSMLESAAGFGAAGASAGTMVTPGWGTAILGAVGAVAGGIGGYMSADEKDYCQEIESCEDINVHEQI